jgi:hypothetical protein
MAWDSLFKGGLSGGYGDLGGYTDIFGGGSSGFDWGDALGAAFGSGGGGGSSGSNWLSALGGLFGGGDSGGGGGGGDIFSALLGGLGGAAGAYLDKDTIKAGAEEQGKQQRKTLDFTASLEDYYKQLDKRRKRTALDTYGQFSLLDRWAPDYTAAQPVEVPARPGS